MILTQSATNGILVMSSNVAFYVSGIAVISSAECYKSVLSPFFKISRKLSSKV